MQFEGNRYLLSGVAGFLGTNMALRLLKGGGEVVGVDNMYCGSQRNLQELSSCDNFSFYHVDIREPLDCLPGTFTHVLNYACPASPPRYYGDPELTMETCSLGVSNMLKRALQDRARFLQTSTSEVYGNPLEHPQTESYPGNVVPYTGRSCYDEGKRYAEALVYIYRHRHKVDSLLIRIFNTYGPWMDPFDGRVITNFIRQALTGAPIEIQDFGQQTRSFCYVDDQIEAQVRAIHCSLEGPINIGNPEEFTIAELAETVKRLTGSNSEIVNVSPAPSDPTRRRPDITLAQKHLDWSPTVPLEEGLLRTISWFQTIGY